MPLNPSSTDALIKALKDKKDLDPDIYAALKSMQLDLTAVRNLLQQKEEELTRLDRPNDFHKLVFPRNSNPPPLSQPVEGLSFYNTSRARHQGSTDTWPFYDIYTPESCRLTHSVDQAIADATATVLTFDTEIFDHYDLYKTAAPTRITIPLDGRYLIGGCARFDANAVGYRFIFLRINGATFIGSDSRMGVTVAVTFTDINVATVYEFVTGDYIELMVQQNSGGPLDVLAQPDLSAIFYCHRLG